MLLFLDRLSAATARGPVTPWLPAHFWIRPNAASATPPTALLLHGILGSARNIRTLATQLAARLPHWQWLLVDLRSHGDSRGAPPPHTIGACVADLEALCRHLGVAPTAVIGHSFGGKVALELATPQSGPAWPELRSVWALDTQPHLTAAQDLGHGAVNHGAASTVIAAIRRCPGPFASRNAMTDQLVAQGQSAGVAQWMTTNLTQQADGLVWRFELPGVEQLLNSYFEVDSWPVLAAPAEGVTVHMLRAGREPRWTPDITERLERTAHPRLHLHVLANAGHWVHVDDLLGLLAMLTADLGTLQYPPRSRLPL